MPHNHRTRALIVVTSHSKLGNSGRATGFYFDEMAAAYWAMRDAGHAVEIASINGGNAPFDPGSVGEAGKRPQAVDRFLNDPAAMAALGSTPAVAALRPRDFAAVFLPGGHGTMWDFRHPALATFVGAAFDAGAVIGAVCHGPAGLIDAKCADGRPLVAGLKVNSFTDAEEAAVNLTDVVPFLIETELRAAGAHFEGAANFQAHAVRDGRLVTGQNPRSVERVCGLLLEALADHAPLTATRVV